METTQPKPAKTLEFSYGIVLLRTRRFQALMDRLGKSRFTARFGWAMLYLLPVVGAAGMYLLLLQTGLLFSPQAGQAVTSVRSISPLAYIGVPGLNPYLPIVDGWIALFFAMIIHEGSHGVIARNAGLPVKSAGLMFFLFVPIGAFVEVDDKQLGVTSFKNSGRVLAGGAGVNFIAGLVFLMILISMVSTMVPAANGWGVAQVYASTPAAAAGMRPGDFIVAVDGVPYAGGNLSFAGYSPGQGVNLTVWRSGGTFVLNDVRLAPSPVNGSAGYLGVVALSSRALEKQVSGYTGLLLTRPVSYLCIPTLPRCSGVPFGPDLASLYVSGYGQSFGTLVTMVYWLFFLNFNLAIFNAVPIYPLDGGQAFKLGLRSAVRGRLSDKSVNIVTVVVTFATLALLLALPIASYM